MSAFPISILDTNCVYPFDADPPRGQSRRRQHDIITRAQAGDNSAFTEIYLLHRKRVLSICIRMVHDFSLAEDLAQDTFVQLHRKISSFRGDSAFTTWLHRITVNIVLMHLRKSVLSVVSLDEIMACVPEERAGREFGSRDLAQAGVVDRLALNRAVDMLAPGYRSIYVLHDVEGFGHVEIAEMQKCSMGNSKSQLHKARRALRSALGPQPVPERAQN
ncbi:MAG: sigma-70 family RNA polymerase sigma factor [Terracidiphilus sp.]|jgi:RNA polymerase sigma-70 factor (ECF subfamily)